jgi:hypothetical protein
MLGYYVIDAGVHTTWWGCAWLPERHARLPEGRAWLLEIEGDVMQNHEPKKWTKM